MEHGKCVNVCIGIGIIISSNNESSIWFGRPYELGRSEKKDQHTRTLTAATCIDKFPLKMMHVFIYAINLFVRLWHKHGRMSEFWYTLTAWVRNTRMQLQCYHWMCIGDDGKRWVVPCSYANSCIVASSDSNVRNVSDLHSPLLQIKRQHIRMVLQLGVFSLLLLFAFD